MPPPRKTALLNRHQRKTFETVAIYRAVIFLKVLSLEPVHPYQVEGAAAKGGKSISVWDDMTLRTPDMIVDGSNGNVACDMYHRYKDDIKVMKQMGFDGYRFSISWPRVLPGGRTSAGINKEGIDYYNDLINTILANGMTPFVTLFHWDLPYCLQLEYGGMLSDQIVNDFVEYAELCFQEFGDRVKFWTTFNEPWSYVVHGYTLEDHYRTDDPTSIDSTVGQPSSESGQMSLPPNRLSKKVTLFDSTFQPSRNTWFPVNDPAKDAYTAARNLLLCHSAAVQSYREKFQDDQQAVQRAFDFMIGWFLEPVIYGQFPTSMLDAAGDNIVPFSDDEKQGLAGSVDWVGLNYYTADFVAYEKDPSGVGYPADQHCIYSYYDKNQNPIGQPTVLSWLWMVPQGLYDHLKDLNFDVRGFFAWSYCDNFEWNAGYTSRFGIMYTDYVNNLTRYMKNSAFWFTKFLRASSTTLPAIDIKGQVEKDPAPVSKKRRAT
ncbi:UNVERIFIED_CONTAM: Raucaffricine-O-beta-D-glucosidase [Sesamum calycinum]|uniref:Raucaffricine-O-beta-D-glucosidase n=1 Tax=Sesamum calycinum TaxID=2727403 RepID=A0AAW2NIR0_9LAMI